MASADDWTSSSTWPVYTTGGNACQTLKVSKKGKTSTKKGISDLNDNKLDHVNIWTTAKYQGWSVSGIKRFNELFDLVEKEQASIQGAEFEEKFLKYCIDQKQNGKKTEKKKHIVYEKCQHELWSSQMSEEKVI